MVLRFYIEQTEGISRPERPPVKRIAEVEEFIDALGANVIHGNMRAYYLPKFDQIHLPDPEDFKSMEDYYAVALHEHTHWTGHESRLNRPLVNRFGSEEYAQEELVAELGSAFLCSHLQVTPVLREDHAAYIKSWIKILKDDKRAIFKASACCESGRLSSRESRRRNTSTLGEMILCVTTSSLLGVFCFP